MTRTKQRRRRGRNLHEETAPPLSQNGDVLNADPLVAQNRRLSTSHGRNLHEETAPPLSQNGDVLNADPLVARNGRLSTSQYRRRKKWEAKVAKQSPLSLELALLSGDEGYNDRSKRRRLPKREGEEIKIGGGIGVCESQCDENLDLPNCNVEENENEGNLDLDYGLQRGTHGYGIQPLGNLLLSASSSNLRDASLGALQVLSDETIYDILSNLDGRDLARLALVSKGFYVFSHQDSLWRTLVLENYKGKLAFNGCWKTTYLASAVPGYSGVSHVPLKVKDFYSDYLFQSWLCASLEIKEEWLKTDNIERRENLSVEDFIRDFEEPNKPVLLSGVLETWPALTKWDREYLLRHTVDVDFAAGPINLKLDDYFNYADKVEEERPLYIFDPKFGEKAPQLAADYEVPIYFREDLFNILGTEDRPDYRWLIAGPARSGSSFHIDPNSTSAWNAVVRGAKKWVMYPPEVVPPGVYPSPDGADVATPVSITEWFMNFYGETKQRVEKPVECICRVGEVVFVPRGWWHIVINLEESIAITQNFVSRSNILNVLEFLSRPNSKDLVSGTKDRVNLYERFRSKYESLYPGSIESIQQKTEERKASLQKTSIWDSAADLKTGGFKFSF